ncbi:MAG: mechanosensitive ion channel domain-containing protein, partial [Alphaproteobacteria bacterium]
ASMMEMWSWLEADVGSETGRSRWQDILRAVGISLGAALVAFFAVGLLLRRFGRQLNQRGQTFWGRLLRGVAAFLVDVLPVIAFAAAGSAALAAVSKGAVAGAMTAALLSVLTIALAACALVRIVTRPHRPALRLLPVSDGVARDITRRSYWIIGVMTAAYAMTGTLPLVGMPLSARTAVLTIAALVAAVMMIAAIVRHRRPVRHAIERSARKGTLTGDAALWLAGYWHVIAVVVVVALLVTYIVGGDMLFVDVVAQIGWTLLVLAGCYAVWRLLIAYHEQQQRRSQAAKGEGDLVRESGHVMIRLFARLVLAIVTLGLLVHLWLFDVIEWLGNDAGRALLEGAITIAIILILAYAANRAIVAVIQRIQHSGRGSAAHGRRRVETLLPLLRSAAAVVIIAVTFLIVLSEIGLDITPLLASAGVLGLAIGFGAQSLVKDVITGMFFLVEDAFGVGDIVTVAGYSGVVEEMSIRSIKLRDFGGIVHVIPFGVVDAASNMTRGFSFAVFEVGVSYGSDVDQVIACMREVDQELRTDPAMAAAIIEPIDVVGLDSFGDNAVVIKARIKTWPAKQWGVMRAYNRLLKMRFDERGIEIPFPQRTVHIRQTAPEPGVAPMPAAPSDPEPPIDPVEQALPTPEHESKAD